MFTPSSHRRLFQECRSSVYSSDYDPIFFLDGWDKNAVDLHHDNDAEISSSRNSCSQDTTKSNMIDDEWKEKCQSLMIDSSIHTIDLKLEPIDSSSLFEESSNSVQESIKTPSDCENTIMNPSSSSTAEEPFRRQRRDFLRGTHRRNSVSFNFDEDIDFSDILDLVLSEDNTIDDSNPDHILNARSEQKKPLYFTQSRRDRLTKERPVAEAMQEAFVQEYDFRVNQLHKCMIRTTSSRSKVANIKQYLKMRHFSKHSLRRKSKLGVNPCIRSISPSSTNRQALLEVDCTL